MTAHTTPTRPPRGVGRGATTTGKTDLAADLARDLGGELVNADKFHLFDGFSVGTGRSDAESHADVPRHLFACVPADGRPPSVGMWLRWLERVVADVRSRGRVPVVEGSSFGLASAAARLAARTPGSAVVGLRWRRSDVLADRVAARVSAACGAGLLDETAWGLSQGLEHGWVMQKSVVFPAMVDHLRGRCTLDTACARVGDAVTAAAAVQSRKFAGVEGVRWFDHAREVAVA